MKQSNDTIKEMKDVKKGNPFQQIPKKAKRRIYLQMLKFYNLNENSIRRIVKSTGITLNTVFCLFGPW
jgi:hypothetical protein